MMVQSKRYNPFLEIFCLFVMFTLSYYNIIVFLVILIVVGTCYCFIIILIFLLLFVVF